LRPAPAAALLVVLAFVVAPAVAEQLLAHGDRGRDGDAQSGAGYDLLPRRETPVVFRLFHRCLLRLRAVSFRRSPR